MRDQAERYQSACQIRPMEMLKSKCAVKAHLAAARILLTDAILKNTHEVGIYKWHPLHYPLHC